MRQLRTFMVRSWCDRVLHGTELMRFSNGTLRSKKISVQWFWPVKVTLKVIKRRPKVFCWSCDEGSIKWDKKIFWASSVCNFSPAMGARNQVGIGLAYQPASLCSLATQFQTRFLESIPRPMAGLKFSTQFTSTDQMSLLSTPHQMVVKGSMPLKILSKVKKEEFGVCGLRAGRTACTPGFFH